MKEIKNQMSTWKVCCAALLVTFWIAGANAFQYSGFDIVKSKKKPEHEWKEYPTHTLDHLPGFKTPPARFPLDSYGGRLDKKANETGFFHVQEIDGRWWLVDPLGHLFIHKGMCSTRWKASPAVQTAFDQKFGTHQKWAEQTTALLKQNGFNGTGAWSDTEYLPQVDEPLAYTRILNIMSSFGGSKKLTYQKPGHRGYPNDCFPVFHPEFIPFVDEFTQEISAYSEDTALLGYFTDNELPAPRNLLDKHLQLDPSHPDLVHGYQAACDWLKNRNITDFTAITDDDREDFREYVYATYFRIVTEAIRKQDPNHMIFGPRLHGGAKNSPGIMKAAGRYLDVIAINYYNVWGPDLDEMKQWYAWSGRPVMITEWYTKGMDSGYPNNSGAGWVVPTQDDRGKFYQHFVLGLLESKTCVGWHWFKYMDNDPDDLTTDPSNRDSNKGIVTIQFDPYNQLLRRMSALNEHIYHVIDWMDHKND
jgi:hypothetical protein